MISNSLKMMVDANTAPVINSLSVTKNGTYTAPEGVDGYSPITVDVVEEPWEPLEDGYSNFWFELTNDTLSPWLNFSAKTESAVIDWGDGSGEVALDTLTPTHTYAKAGRYVVKCKGVTGIAVQHSVPYQGQYFDALKYVEHNNEVISLSANCYKLCVGLKKCITKALANDMFSFCSALKSFELEDTLETIPRAMFYYCLSLTTIIIPSEVTTINNYVFYYCQSLSEIHCQPTNPPTASDNAFAGLSSNYIIYVPVGTAETYKAASGWSNYADHILEEGQTPNRMMLAKFNSAKTDEPQDDMR